MVFSNVTYQGTSGRPPPFRAQEPPRGGQKVPTVVRRESYRVKDVLFERAIADNRGQFSDLPRRDQPSAAPGSRSAVDELFDFLWQLTQKSADLTSVAAAGNFPEISRSDWFVFASFRQCGQDHQRWAMVN